MPNGFEIGCRYARKPGIGKVTDGGYELVLGPACQAAVRLAK